MKIELEVEEILNKEVKENKGAKVGYVYLPRTWVGRDITICLLKKRRKR